MKTKKYLLHILAAAMLTAPFTACDNDGDIIYTSGPSAADMNSSSTNIVLNSNELSALVLTLYWNDNGEISLSDPEVAAPEGAVANTVQMSTDPEFTNVYNDLVESGVYERQYTCQELNDIVSGRLSMEGGKAGALYVRIASSVGNNIPANYSNVLELTVTPFFIDMSRAEYLDNTQTPTGRYLYNVNADGVYVGFIGAASWENWYLREGNNVLWGNENVNWTAFKLGSGAQAGNMWYPEPAGCYYSIVNTNALEWSALLIESLTLSGDLTGDMTFEQRTNRWLFTVANATAGTYNVTISGQAKLYDVATGTDNSLAVAKTVSFGGASTNLEFLIDQPGTPVTVTVGENGEALIALDLNDFNACTIGTGEAAEPEPEPEVPDMPEGVTLGDKLFASGLVEWDWTRYLKQYDAATFSYAGVHYIKSEWGYKLYPESENWDSFFAMNSGDAYEGTLQYGVDKNISAPETATYLMNVCIKEMTYALTKVESVSFTGLNNAWDFTPMTVDADNPMIYTAEFEKTEDPDWGFQVILNEDWGLKLGAYEGELHPYSDGKAAGNDVENGTYILTVDFENFTYTYTKK